MEISETFQMISTFSQIEVRVDLKSGPVRIQDEDVMSREQLSYVGRRTEQTLKGRNFSPVETRDRLSY